MTVFIKQTKGYSYPDRIIRKIEGSRKGPLILFFAGIHGNEPAGVLALEKALGDLESQKEKIAGTIYGIIGNRNALSLNKRYIDVDLNRIWISLYMDKLEYNPNLLEEEKEMNELLQLIHPIIENATVPVYFIDFHTTSSKSYPFITINDALINRKFAMKFPVPIVLGIEEYLEGPMLSYINQKGYVALGFEAGQHLDENSVKNTVSFIYLTLVFTGVIKKRSFGEFDLHFSNLETSAQHLQKIFEIVHLHKIAAWDKFSMITGFDSFQVIKKDTHLAIHNDVTIKAPFSGRIFMPLYQSQGSDGFFIVHRIPYWVLKFSAFLRKYKVDNLLTMLPGVTWENREKEVLIVNLKTARFLAKPFFHLFGYRVRIKEGHYLRLYNRERSSKKKLYKKTKWF
jgi:predicted deacylase